MPHSLSSLRTVHRIVDQYKSVAMKCSSFLHWQKKGVLIGRSGHIVTNVVVSDSGHVEHTGDGRIEGMNNS